MSGAGGQGLAFRGLVLAACAAAALFAAIATGDGPRSPFDWLQYILIGLVALVAARLPGDRPARPWLFVVLVLGLGLLLELSLTVNGTGLGGVHPQTGPSMVLAFGDYALLGLAVLGVWRVKPLGAPALAALIAGIALTEGLVFTGSLAGAVASGDVVSALLVLAYLTVLYWAYLWVPALWCGIVGGGRLNAGLALVAGFALGFAVRVVWGLVYAPLASAVLGIEAP